MTDQKLSRPSKPKVGQIWVGAPDPIVTERRKRCRILAVVEGYVVFRPIYGDAHMLRERTFMKWHRLSAADDAALTPAEREAERMGADLANITRREAFAGARRIAGRKWETEPNWVVAKEVFGVGSTYAWALCQEMGIDGDATTVDPHP